MRAPGQSRVSGCGSCTLTMSRPVPRASAMGRGKRDLFPEDRSSSPGRESGTSQLGRPDHAGGDWSGVLLCQAQSMSSGLSGLFSATVQLTADPGAGWSEGCFPRRAGTCQRRVQKALQGEQSRVGGPAQERVAQCRVLATLPGPGCHLGCGSTARRYARRLLGNGWRQRGEPAS